MSTGPTTQIRSKAHDYLDPLDRRRLIMGEKVVDELTETKAFRRLGKIRFLGAIDYVLVRAPNQIRRRYTRSQHSRGVAELARQYAELAELSYEDRRLACVAALLHDIGHAPLSHSLEQVFFEYFDIEHHRATEDIIAGRVEIGHEVYATLRWHGIDVERLLAVIDGQETSFDGFFSGPINFDTIEGILRTISYVTKAPTATRPRAVVQAATMRATNFDQQIIDGFWQQKDFVYREFINSRQGIVADTISKKIMKENIGKFSRETFFYDEDGLFVKIPELRKVLISHDFMQRASIMLEYPVAYNKRVFFIDEAYDFQARQDASRYRQKKVPDALLSGYADAIPQVGLRRDFFDDDPI